MSQVAMISGVTDGGQGCAPPPVKLNVKNGPPLRDIMNCRI